MLIRIVSINDINDYIRVLLFLDGENFIWIESIIQLSPKR